MTSPLFIAGIWWKIKNSKFIVCKFAMDSEAPKKGVKVGDILRSVDGVDILNHKVDEEVSVQVISTLVCESLLYSFHVSDKTIGKTGPPYC